MKKPTFRPVTLNKSFLKEQAHAPGPVSSLQSAALSSSKGYSYGSCDASRVFLCTNFFLDLL
jgi:hypothetical protein